VGKTSRLGRPLKPVVMASAAKLVEMRRLLVIVLLALLPLQFSWAAVGAYCQHESAQAGAAQPGHHEHRHHADPTTDAGQGDDADRAAGEIDLDCGHCHGHFTAMLPRGNEMPAHRSTAHASASADAKPGAHAPARPERPQWAPLA
jgi:hypothetical protein